jgi:hypothetical protein
VQHYVDTTYLSNLGDRLADAADQLRQQARQLGVRAAPGDGAYGRLDSANAAADAYASFHGAMVNHLNSAADQLQSRAQQLAYVAAEYARADQDATAVAHSVLG